MSFTLYMVIINTSFWLLLNYGVAYGVRLVPPRFYRNTRAFREQPFERRLYARLRITKWKDRLPMMNAALKKLENNMTPAYLDRMIMETYYAEFGHLTIAVLGFLIIWVNPNEYMWMAWIFAVVNFFIHILFCIIQRYNRPRLLKVKRYVGSRGK